MTSVAAPKTGSASTIPTQEPNPEFVKAMTLTDATMLVAGSMIGSGIFIVSASMSRTLGSPFWLLLAWIVTGVITLLGALAYGELAAMFPRAGGQYVFLRESMGPLMGFLYGWTLFVVIQTGTIAAVARSEEHTSELQSPCNLVCRLLLEKKILQPLNSLREH